MSTVTIAHPRASMIGARRLVRRLEHERRKWSYRQTELVPTDQAWRAGVAEGLRLAQIAIRKGV